MLLLFSEWSYLFVGRVSRWERLLCRLPQTSEPQTRDESALVPPDVVCLPRVGSSGGWNAAVCVFGWGRLSLTLRCVLEDSAASIPIGSSDWWCDWFLWRHDDAVWWILIRVVVVKYLSGHSYPEVFAAVVRSEELSDFFFFFFVPKSIWRKSGG